MARSKQERPGDDAVLSFITIITATKFGVHPSLITAQTRVGPVCEARHTAVTLAYTLYDMPCERLAPRFGFRKHCSVLHSRKTVCNMFDTDRTRRDRIIEIVREIGRPVEGLRDQLGARKWAQVHD